MARIYSAGRSTNGLSRKTLVENWRGIVQDKVYILIHHKLKTENAIQIVAAGSTVVIYQFFDIGTQSVIAKKMSFDVWQLDHKEMELYTTV